ncbi:hypothetical protein [Nocardia sp. CNY236]|uniref:hypothetical protein n=1 Tax=Nocardia sp. CNY236 TaxID=1169152 RepID=UPI000422F20E|nr:hypothetical protein [Nocardia sp. CNY236]
MTDTSTRPRRRLEFCLTVTVVVALTGLGIASLVLPNTTLPQLRVGPASTTDSIGEAEAVDPRLAEIQRIVEPFGPIIARHVPTGDGRRSLIVGHPSQEMAIDTLEREVAAATEAVTAVWGPDWAQSALVVVASSPSEFAGLLRATSLVPAEVAAASVADPISPGHRPTGQRVVFSSEAARRLTPEELAGLLRHELTHIAARSRTVIDAPRWMLEGFADYVAHHGRGHRFSDIVPTLVARARAGDLPHALPTDAEFAGPDAALGYETAWSVCAFVAEKYDLPHLVQLYVRIASAEQDPTSEDHVLREVLGTTRSGFLADWHAWLAARAG